MPTSVIDALGALIGQTVSIAVDSRTITGVLASVTGSLTIMSTSAGVIYVNTANIRAVGTTGGTTTATTVSGTTLL